MDAPEQQTAPRPRAGTRWAAVGGLGAVAALSAVLLTGPWGAEDAGSPAATATAPAEAVSAAPATPAPTGTPSAAPAADRPSGCGVLSR